MINSIEIQNFKGFSNLDLFDIPRITLFGGKNNTGKTSLLEVLFMFTDRLNPNFILRQYNWRGVNELSTNPQSLLAPIFHNFDLNKEITVRVKLNNTYEKMILKYNKDDGRSIELPRNENGHIRTDQINQVLFSLDLKYERSGEKAQKAQLIIDNQGIELQANNVRSMGYNSTFLASKFHGDPNENAVRFGELDINGSTDKIVEFLKIVEPNLKSLSSITLNNRTSLIHGDIGIGRKIPISYMGDGMSRILTILLSIASSPNGIIFIDEIENGIHYSVLPKVWEVISAAAQEFNCQIFATTHSYECLTSAIKGLPSSMYEEFKYIRLQRDYSINRVIPKTFDFKVLKAAIEKGWEVR